MTMSSLSILQVQYDCYCDLLDASNLSLPQSAANANSARVGKRTYVAKVIVFLRQFNLHLNRKLQFVQPRARV